METLHSAVEMPGPWKTWKTKLRFSTFPTAPWKSPPTRFPQSHRAEDDPWTRKCWPTKQLPDPPPAGYKLCVLGRSPMAAFEVTPYGRF